MAAIFISYRRNDAWAEARALSTDLTLAFGEDSVFMDVDSIALGRDFRVVLSELLASCQVMIVLIGPKWLDARGKDGKRRLDSTDDWVRAEVAAALGRDIPVVPVLVDGAVIPTADQLPADISKLAYRNAFELTQQRWKSDVGALVDRLGLPRPGQPRQAATAPAATPPGRPSPPAAARAPQPAPVPAPAPRAAPAAEAPASPGSPWAAWGMLGALGLGVVILFQQCASDDAPSAPAAQPTGQSQTVAPMSGATVRVGALVWTTRRQGSVHWVEAGARCQRLRLDGLTGWRLPRRQELRSLYDVRTPAPGGERILRPFHDGLGGNWIWSADKDTATTAFAVDFKTGKDVSLATSIADGAGVLCVRPAS